MIKFHHLLRLGSTLSSGFKAELSDALGLRSQKVTLPVPCFAIYYYYYSMPMRKHIHVYMPMYAHTHLPRHSSLAGVRSFQFDLQREKLLVSLYSLLIFFLPLNIFCSSFLLSSFSLSSSLQILMHFLYFKVLCKHGTLWQQQSAIKTIACLKRML